MAVFSPRLTKDGIWQNSKWYTDNPFYTSGYGMPNCTCYAWGRFWEVGGGKPSLPTSDGGQWWDDAKAAAIYKTGQIAQVGAVACFSRAGYSGHVCIVEKVLSGGQLQYSNSGYQRPLTDYPPDMSNYFWTDVTVDKRHTAWMSDYTFQGFIYNPLWPPGTTPTGSIPPWMIPIIFNSQNRRLNQ